MMSDNTFDSLLIKYKDIVNHLKQLHTTCGVLNERFNHSLEVAKMALKLNDYYKFNLDIDKVFLSSLLHDCCKLKSNEELLNILKVNESNSFYNEVKRFPKIYHSFSGKWFAKTEFNINDVSILNAIYYHSTGCKNMTLLEKIVFISDYIEETRQGLVFIQARKKVFENFDEGLTLILSNIVNNLKSRNEDIFRLTFEAYEYYNKTKG